MTIKSTASMACFILLLLTSPSASAAEDRAMRLSWEKNILTISGADLPGREMKILYIEAYCRPGSTNRQWPLTTIGHKTRIVSQSDDGHSLTLECAVNDGIKVTHQITAKTDEIDFQITATNPTDKPSDAHWAQPCIRVGEFTGRTKENYLDKSFIFLDGKLSRMPTRNWAMQAVYIPGQVWCPKGVNRNDVNPRPLSDAVPDNGLIGCFSADEKKMMAVAFEPYQELFQGVITCLHSDFRIGGLKPGETKKIRGKIYIVPANVDALLNRYYADFPEHAAAAKAAAAKPPAKAPDDKAILGDIRQEHVMIPMRDGAKLSTYLYFPPGQGPWPVIYQQRYVEINSRGQRSEDAKMASLSKCVVALENFRGAHESEGVFQGYRALGLGDSKDGYDTVEWLAKQPWCTGKIGSFGGSQGGYSQNFLAASRPPHLVAQYLTDFGVSLFHDGYRGGGVVRPTRFLTRMANHARDFQEGRAALAEQLKHPTYDDWWKQEDTTLHFAQMDYPSVMLGGWFDPVHKAVIQAWQGREEHFPGKQYLILGPWAHGTSYRGTGKVGDLDFPQTAVFDVRGHIAKWFAYHLRGEQNGVMDEPKVRYYVMGECGEKDAPGHMWRTDKTFPPRGVQDTPQYFSSGGKLGAAVPSGDPSSTYTSDPYHPNKITGDNYPSAKDQRAYEEHGDVLTFTSEPLKSPIEWTGLVKTKLWVSSTAKDTDFIVRVTDVYPDGRSILLMDHIRRARFREGFEQEKLMEPGKIYPIDFELGYISMTFNAGHRIRVTIGSTGDDWYEVNPQTGGPFGMEPSKEMVVAKNTIYHDKEHPSQIIAPVYKK